MYLPKLIKIHGNFTKFRQKQKCTVFLRHGVYAIFLHTNNETVYSTWNDLEGRSRSLAI